MNQYINNNKKVYCTFIDYTMSFDYVVGSISWYKLVNIRVRGKMLSITNHIYKYVPSSVKVFF